MTETIEPEDVLDPLQTLTDEGLDVICSVVALQPIEERIVRMRRVRRLIWREIAEQTGLTISAAYRRLVIAEEAIEAHFASGHDGGNSLRDLMRAMKQNPTNPPVPGMPRPQAVTAWDVRNTRGDEWLNELTPEAQCEAHVRAMAKANQRLGRIRPKRPITLAQMTTLLQRLKPRMATNGADWLRSIAHVTGWKEPRVSALAATLGLGPELKSPSAK